MKPTFYLLYIVRGPRDSVWEENMKEKQRGNLKKKTTTTDNNNTDKSSTAFIIVPKEHY